MEVVSFVSRNDNWEFQFL